MQELAAQPTEMIAKLRFDTPVIILGSGDFDPELLLELVEDGFPLIAADGAADVAKKVGLPIMAIIGDFDSISDPQNFADHIVKLHLKEQETTDFEKCLYSVDAPLFICFGMLGKRFDHSMAAVHAIARFGAEKNIILVDQSDVSLGVSGDFSMQLPVGERFSVFPLRDIGFVQSKGLLYPLDDLTLRIGARIGTSNQVSNENVEIVVDEQSTDESYLIILARQHLNRLIALFVPKD